MSRLITFILAIMLLLFLGPIFCFISILVFLKLGSPIFFRQERPGYKGNVFTLLKFRTMLDASDFNGNLLADGERLTPFGSWLRASSLDELPELFNVIKGEMAFVGPRPILLQYQDYFTEEELQRFNVLPGITGWAQINGRNNVHWDKRLSMDVDYVKRKSFLFDLKIMLLTVKKVIVKDGVSVNTDDVEPFLNEIRKKREGCS